MPFLCIRNVMHIEYFKSPCTLRHYFKETFNIFVRDKQKVLVVRKKRPWWDSNPQSPAPEADALSIRPQGQVAKSVHL